MRYLCFLAIVHLGAACGDHSVLPAEPPNDGPPPPPDCALLQRFSRPDEMVISYYEAAAAAHAAGGLGVATGEADLGFDWVYYFDAQSSFTPEALQVYVFAQLQAYGLPVTTADYDLYENIGGSWSFQRSRIDGMPWPENAEALGIEIYATPTDALETEFVLGYIAVVPSVVLATASDRRLRELCMQPQPPDAALIGRTVETSFCPAGEYNTCAVTIGASDVIAWHWDMPAIWSVTYPSLQAGWTWSATKFVTVALHALGSMGCPDATLPTLGIEWEMFSGTVADARLDCLSAAVLPW